MIDPQIKQALLPAMLIPLLTKIPALLSAGYTAVKAAPYVARTAGAVAKLPGMLKSWATASKLGTTAARAAGLAGKAKSVGSVARTANLANRARRAHSVARVMRPASLTLMAMPAATRGLNRLSGYNPEEEQGQRELTGFKKELMQLGPENPLYKQYMAMGN